MRSFRKQFAFHWRDNRKRLLWFGGIVLFIDFWLIAGFGIYEPEKAMAWIMNNNFAAISIFILLTAYITAVKSFPLFIGSGYTRKQYYWSSLIYFGSLSMAVSLAQTLLMAALKQLLPLLGVDLRTTVTSYGMLWYSQTAVFFLLAMLFFLASTLMYRFGLSWGAGLIAVYFLSLGALRTDNPTLIDATAKTLVDIVPPHFAIAISAGAAFICWQMYRSANVNTPEQRNQI